MISSSSNSLLWPGRCHLSDTTSTTDTVLTAPRASPFSIDPAKHPAEDKMPGAEGLTEEGRGNALRKTRMFENVLENSPMDLAIFGISFITILGTHPYFPADGTGVSAHQGAATQYCGFMIAYTVFRFMHALLYHLKIPQARSLMYGFAKLSALAVGIGAMVLAFAIPTP